MGLTGMRAQAVLFMPVALALMAGAPPPAATPSAPAAAAAPGPEALAVAAPAAPSRDALLRFLLRPYADATQTSLAQPAWDGSPEGLSKLLGGHAADVVLLDGAKLTILCHGGPLARLDWNALGRDRFLQNATGDCGAGAYVSATVLTWDRDKLAGTPNWGDFWDVAKHPGRRGLRRGARGNLEVALLADGVSPGDVYRTLRSSDGVDRAFRKLDQLKPYVLWWDELGQPGQMLATAKVLLTSAPSNMLPVNVKLHLGTQWEGGLEEIQSWAVPAQAPHSQAAAASLVITTDPARLAQFARATGLGPATHQAWALLPADQREASPSSPEHLAQALPIDEGFWAENGEKLESRFAAWVGK